MLCSQSLCWHWMSSNTTTSSCFSLLNKRMLAQQSGTTKFQRLACRGTSHFTGNEGASRASGRQTWPILTSFRDRLSNCGHAQPILLCVPGHRPEQRQRQASHYLPEGSSPCMFATYLKFGLASALPGLLEISKTQSSVPFRLFPMLNRREMSEHPVRFVNSLKCCSYAPQTQAVSQANVQLTTCSGEEASGHRARSDRLKIRHLYPI